jgi:hypothetical protein
MWVISVDRVPGVDGLIISSQCIECNIDLPPIPDPAPVNLLGPWHTPIPDKLIELSGGYAYIGRCDLARETQGREAEGEGRLFHGPGVRFCA